MRSWWPRSPMDSSLWRPRTPRPAAPSCRWSIARRWPPTVPRCVLPLPCRFSWQINMLRTVRWTASGSHAGPGPWDNARWRVRGRSWTSWAPTWTGWRALSTASSRWSWTKTPGHGWQRHPRGMRCVRCLRPSASCPGAWPWTGTAKPVWRSWAARLATSSTWWMPSKTCPGTWPRGSLTHAWWVKPARSWCRRPGWSRPVWRWMRRLGWPPSR